MYMCLYGYFSYCYKKTWQKWLEEGRASCGLKLVGIVPRMTRWCHISSVAAGVWGAWSHCVPNQEAEREECWCPPPCLPSCISWIFAYTVWWKSWMFGSESGVLGNPSLPFNPNLKPKRIPGNGVCCVWVTVRPRLGVVQSVTKGLGHGAKILGLCSVRSHAFSYKSDLLIYLFIFLFTSIYLFFHISSRHVA